MHSIIPALAVIALAAAAPCGAQQIDTARALAALRDARTSCLNDAGAMWHHDLCGPIALADRQTRMVVMNDTASRRHYVPVADAFVSVLPENQFIANTSFQWNNSRENRDWTLVALPLPADRYARVALVMHEVFHREQRALGLGALDALNNHLDFREGRTWLRLELRALAAALRAPSLAETRRHATNALVFRAYRRSLYKTADSTETLLETQEGIPEYTGQHLAMALTGEGPARVAQSVVDFERNTPTFVRAFAYGTGPGIGVVLDRLNPQWRDEFVKNRNLSMNLALAVSFKPPPDLRRTAMKLAAEYGWSEIDRAEAARDSAREPMLRDYRSRFGEGPTILLRQSKDSLRWGYDPTTLVAFDETSLIYPSGTFVAPWGKLQVDSSGVLVANDFSTIRVAAPSGGGASTESVRGVGWSLELNPGWKVERDADRPGSFVVRR